MKRLFKTDEWKIVEEKLHAEDNRLAESMMSLGNGYMGMRGNFEETFSGDTHQGTYIGGVYYPDKTRVGWWKNGYPEYFAKVLNATNITGINVNVNGTEIDLAKVEFKDYYRELNMKHGYLFRTFTMIDGVGRETKVEVTRFFSITEKEIAAVSYKVTPLNHDAHVTFTPYLDGDVRNEDANYDEDFWMPVEHSAGEYEGLLTMRTRKTEYDVTSAMKAGLFGGRNTEVTEVVNNEEYVANTIAVSVNADETAELVKIAAVTTSRDIEKTALADRARKLAQTAYDKGFGQLLEEQKQAWEDRWKGADVKIVGDAEAQQGIRFNIFHLYNTYTGEDPTLNIGPKGFTGEKYGGSTYWDTEAYCLPFYLGTADQHIARNLLIYRYKHLGKAKENAAKLGLKGALYPMVTMNGEESHNEWEITFEEIHRNGAIAHAIYHYVSYTGDEAYLPEYGFEVLAEISRFWASRVNYQPRKDVYMMLGVTGPNEYENNVNNNWYTNRIAAWTLEYTLEVLGLLKEKYTGRYEEMMEKIALTGEETGKWQEIIDKMYYPVDEEHGIFLQQDGYLDKEQILVSELPEGNLPLNQNWSWDRILRSCFIKQADVLQGLYFLNDRYSLDEKKQNFDFYEPRTVHESSLSPCVYSIIGAEIGYEQKAYELYLRTARLDLDNYNNDTEDGLHITSMAGSWLSIVHGFAGMRVKNGKLSFKPFIPDAWDEYTFKINHRGSRFMISVTKGQVAITLEKGEQAGVEVFGKEYSLSQEKGLKVSL